MPPKGPVKTTRTVKDAMLSTHKVVLATAAECFVKNLPTFLKALCKSPRFFGGVEEEGEGESDESEDSLSLVTIEPLESNRMGTATACAIGS